MADQSNPFPEQELQDFTDLSESSEAYDDMPEAPEDGQELSEEASEEASESLTGRARVYVSSEERCNELSSSGWSLVTVGGIFLALEVLDITGIADVPILDRSQLLMGIVLAAVSLCFIALGISSFRKASQLRGRIDEEKRTTSTITEWFLSTYTPDQIDTAVDALLDREDVSDEERCLARQDIMRQYIEREYPVQEDYLDKLCEDLYEMTFPAPEA